MGAAAHMPLALVSSEAMVEAMGALHLQPPFPAGTTADLAPSAAPPPPPTLIDAAATYSLIPSKSGMGGKGGDAPFSWAMAHFATRHAAPDVHRGPWPRGEPARGQCSLLSMKCRHVQ